ncbi:hypothetical protein EV356DRAFT_520262 [Viridothelium virens]|uniref:DUF1772-domain-containing protein n=1 Tax=Viridothelium virens TaxID=1048519 RepID=A0A6A6HJN3_VIRVR|nr:hypothetical protein EV356DRAFT_520262 [Viridothelium virens]
MTSHPALLLPLCSYSASLALSVFQFPLFIAFLPKPISPTSSHLPQPTASSNYSALSGRPLSYFWSKFIVPGTTVVAALFLTSAISGGLSSRWLHQHRHLETSEIARWYMYGSAASLGHFAFVPFVIPRVRRIIEQVEEKGAKKEERDIIAVNEQETRGWLMVHLLRTLAVDVVAVVCFAKGVALSLWVV